MHDDQWPLHFDDGHSAYRKKYIKTVALKWPEHFKLPRKHDRTLGDGVQSHPVGGQLAKVVEKRILNAVGQRLLQIRNIFGRIPKVVQELEAFVETGEDRELAVKGVFAEVQIEHAHIVGFARFPVRVGHRDLVEVCQI